MRTFRACVQTKVRLPKLRIFNYMRLDVNVFDCTRGLYGHRKTASAKCGLKGGKSLGAPGNRTCRSDPLVRPLPTELQPPPLVTSYLMSSQPQRSYIRERNESSNPVSRCGLAVRRLAGMQKDLGSIRFGSPFSSLQKMWVVVTVL